jgi:NitT/TauT family transport system permease protein
VDPNLIARFQTLHASRFQLFRYVLWPNALPYYAAAHEIAFTSSIVAAVLAEFFFSRQGLGFMLTQAMNDYRGDRLWATNIIIAVLSAAALGLSVLAERLLIPWQRQETRRPGKQVANA